MKTRVVPLVPAAVVAALAAAALPYQVRSAWDVLRESPAGLARTEDAALRELRGDAYADLLAEVRMRVPVDGSYALANGGRGRPDQNWLRCDLAPRVPVALRVERCGGWFFERPPKRVPELAVVVAEDGSAHRGRTESLLSTLWSGLTGSQTDLPGWMDEPAEEQAVKGPVVVSGWCQEKGSRPCASVRVWMDGAEIDPVRLERFPRLDVKEAMPEMGDCSRAGWRVTFDAGTLAPGRHCVAAALLAEGGRHRRVGPWDFTVAR